MNLRSGVNGSIRGIFAKVIVLPLIVSKEMALCIPLAINLEMLKVVMQVLEIYVRSFNPPCAQTS